MLASFIKYLEKNDLVEFDILEDTEACLQNRIKIQMYAFLAKRLGLDLPFKHEIYLFGPYSTSMTDKYYELAENRKRLYDPIKPMSKTSFNSKDFLRLVQDKNLDWLEMAATLINKNKSITQRDDLLENAESTTNGVTRRFITGVLNYLIDVGLVKFPQ